MTKRRSGVFEPSPRGFYPTPRSAAEPLRPFVRGSRLWEPCAGDGALCDHLAAFRAEVLVATDIAPRHPGVHALDALAITEAMVRASGAEVFVTNPPWPEPRRSGQPALAILEHLADLRPTWALLPADFMHNVYAARLMLWCAAIVTVGRVKWIPDSPHDGGLDNACWYCFSRPASDRTYGMVAFYPRIPVVSLSAPTP